jgi:hypothetical protein
MPTPDTSVAVAAPGAKLTAEQTFNLLVEAQEQLRQREAELAALGDKQLQARRDVLTAELQQGDNFTKRARPTVVYAGLVFIGINYVIVPAIAHLAGKPLANGFLPLPTDFWVAWGGIVATWSIGRSFEKTGASNRITRLITGNQAPAPTATSTSSPGAGDGAVG